MKWIFLIVLLAAVVVLLVSRRQRRDSAPPPPLEHRTVDVTDVADYVEMAATTYRVRTLRDVLPGGFSAAMAPVFVVWSRSSFAPGGSIVIRNLNHGGNPLSGVTVLRTAVLRPEKIVRAEYVKVPLARHHSISHGQLRFIFEPGGAEFVDEDASAVGEPDSLNDIVLSWEAWRPPGTAYSIVKGMDPTEYQLTMRAYSGVQRFVEDALQRRDWEVYTLALPGGREGAIELLKVALAMGDGAGRYAMSEMLEKSEGAWVVGGPRESDGDAAASWRLVEEKLKDTRSLGDTRINLAGRTGYHSVVRSCASMALYQVDVAAARLIEQGHAHDGVRLVKIAGITDIPEWMTELSKTNAAGLFLRGPKMIAFVYKYPSAIPGEIPKQLDRAGLLVREGGKPVKREFKISGETPWGPASQLLTR
ncbi:MAG TPA: hypothetical protein VFU38_02430 [Candidatus Krumholzibacteria bacterium]|nr:hypothetical protein [Candidatus Krumholzibacteria bacterium]